MANVKPTRICSIDGCESKAHGRGWCNKHYKRWLHHGDPLGGKHEKFTDPSEAFNSRTEWRDECLIWTGAKGAEGHGHISAHGRLTTAHRFAWEQIHGPIPPGVVVDHRDHCNPACCNVAHLRLVSRGENGRNRSGSNKRSSSGIRNVNWHKRDRKWQVQVFAHGKRHHFGTFDSIEEAAQVAEQARKELFGEFAGKG